MGAGENPRVVILRPVDNGHSSAACLMGMSRVAVMFALGRFDLFPIGVSADELDEDLAHA